MSEVRQRAAPGEKGVEIDISGDGRLTKKVLKAGEEGTEPPPGTVVTVHYVGTLENGKEFDSSRKRNTPFEFQIGAQEVILGWDKGVATMTKGEKAVLRCSPEFGYGNSAQGPIPANSVLLFEVELLDWRQKGPYEDLIKMIPVFLMMISLVVVWFVLNTGK
eukprot:comp26975_c0_seq1/m.47131 comp26975_c0_seq1/g.47131  ORF comp26975_c0_seq1/g.47131 comp26975_c0_seq1/m.47131 type:complete len:162 (-) comp26975_c0_seq1:82-567(-)